MNNTNTFSKFLSGTLIFMLIALFFNIPLYSSRAANLTGVKDTLSRLKASTAADHTIVFTTPTGTPDDGSTITITFPAGFGTALVTEDDVDVAGSTTGEMTTAANCTGAEEVGVVMAADVLTLTICTGDNGDIVAGETVTIEIGANATSSGTGSAANRITNDTAGTAVIAIAGTSSFTDTGSIAISIVYDDVVTITATVAPTITFDIDTAGSGTDICSTTETGTPYSIPLGTITTSNSIVSGSTDIKNYICLDLDTNATGGAVITVKSTNGSNGLVSTSVTADNINSLAGINTIANGTENYGICVTTTSATTGSFTEVSPFNDADCDANDQTPAIGGFDGTSQSLVNTGSAGIAVGRVTVTVAAAISAVTDAHNDYTDTMTFIATGTF